MPTEKELKRLLQMPDELLEKIIEEELEKPEHEMNADLIELCSETLYRRHVSQNKTSVTKRYVRSNVKRIIALAATISILFASIAIAFAESSKNSIKNKLIEAVEGNCTIIDTKNIDTTPNGYALNQSELAKKIEEKGIVGSVTLPDFFVNGDYITSIKDATPNGVGQSLTKTVQIDLKKEKKTGYISITQSDMPYCSEVQIIDLKDIDIYQVNGLDVVLLSFKNKAHFWIRYYDSEQNISYNIVINGSHKEAERIIESIK